MKGLLLTDSLLKSSPDDAIESLKVNHGLSQLDVACYPGFTTRQLIGGDGVVHHIMTKNVYDHIFLVSGVNDFSNNADDCHVLKFKSIAKELNDLIHTFCNQYRHTKITMAPIPMRNVCKEPNLVHRFPNCGSKSWIETTNRAISLFQEYFSICPCHSNQATFLISPAYEIWNPLLSSDGLHLTDDGKRKMIQYFMRTKSHFSVSEEDFPPLPKPSSHFSFKPHVIVPKFVQKNTINKNILIHQCCLKQDTSFKGPLIKISEPSVKVSLPSFKNIKVRKNKPKKTKNPNSWLYYSANTDCCFSQPNHLPKARPKVPRTKKVGNKDQQREEQYRKKQKRDILGKVHWFERKDWNFPVVMSVRGRELVKTNSRRESSVSLKRQKVSKGGDNKMDDNNAQERRILLAKLSKKIFDMKSSRQ